MREILTYESLPKVKCRFSDDNYSGTVKCGIAKKLNSNLYIAIYES